MKLDTQFFSAMLGLCAESKNLSAGKEIHQAINNYQLSARKEDEMVLSSSLVNMYAKCGSLTDAQEVLTPLSTLFCFPSYFTKGLFLESPKRCYFLDCNDWCIYL